ncbi:MAG: hypothetical protein GX242_03430 [Clostridiales bacterium]|nr:hypothetical protein [Clostridiales bacterium]
MKRLLLVCLLLIASVIMVSCGGNVTTPTAAWAGIEVLNYAVEDSNGQNLGTMTTTMRRKSTEGFSYVLEDKEYATADCRMTMELDTLEYQITTTILAKGMNTLAAKKVFVDKKDNANNYTMVGYQDGKRFVYTIDGKSQKKLNVGNANYCLNEFLYMYIRCYGIDSVPGQINIPDIQNGTVIKVVASAKTKAKNFEAVPYPDEAKTVLCNKVDISLKDSPVGKAITVYYTPDQDVYNIDSFASTATTTKKIPVQIIENNITYKLTDIFVA